MEYLKTFESFLSKDIRKELDKLIKKRKDLLKTDKSNKDINKLYSEIKELKEELFYKNDDKYYKKFISLSKEKIEDLKKEYRELKRKGIKNLNDELKEEGHEGTITSIDLADSEIFYYLDKAESEKFNEYSRILDFEDGYKPKKSKKMNENVETTDKLIKTTFQTVTPESAEAGDYAEQGWEDEEGESMMPDEYDIEEGVTAVEKAVQFMKNKGASEPSSSRFHTDVWYSTVYPDRNYKTGEEKYFSFHLKGFTPEEEEEIFNKMKLR
jgi:DNA-binding transcriptional regulator GbsR (MarR family)